MGRVAGAVDGDGGVGGVSVEEIELAAFDEVDRIGVEPVLPKHPRGRAEVAVLQGQHDDAVVGGIGHVEFVVDQHGCLGAGRACWRQACGVAVIGNQALGIGAVDAADAGGVAEKGLCRRRHRGGRVRPLIVRIEDQDARVSGIHHAHALCARQKEDRGGAEHLDRVDLRIGPRRSAGDGRRLSAHHACGRHAGGERRLEDQHAVDRGSPSESAMYRRPAASKAMAAGVANWFRVCSRRWRAGWAAGK